jgi:hypothetical protein
VISQSKLNIKKFFRMSDIETKQKSDKSIKLKINPRKLQIFIKDLELKYRSSINEFQTDELICHMNFYPQLKYSVDSIRKREKLIEAKKESLKRRIKKELSRSKKTEDEIKEMEIIIENKIKSSIDKLREQEDSLIQGIEDLQNILEKLTKESHVLQASYENYSVDDLSEIPEINLQFEKVIQKPIKDVYGKRYKMVPSVIATSDVIRLDGKLVDINTLLRILVGIIHEYRYSENGVAHEITDSLLSTIPKWYHNCLKSIIYFKNKQTNIFIPTNNRIAHMICDI